MSILTYSLVTLSSCCSRYFDDSMEIRGSSFSSWDDSADSYWKKDSSRDLEPAVQSASSSDRWELQAGQPGASLIGSGVDICVTSVLCCFRKWLCVRGTCRKHLWVLESRCEGRFLGGVSVEVSR